MGLTHFTVRLRSLGPQNGAYEADFLVDTGATDSLAPAAELTKVGVQPVGRTANWQMARSKNIRSVWLRSVLWARLRLAA